MATYTDSYGFTKGSAAPLARGLNKTSRIEVTLDFAKIIAARSAAGLTALAASDVLEVLPVPAKSFVSQVGMEVVTTAASGTIALGDTAAASGYLAATAVSSAGVFGVVPTLSAGAFAPTLSGGKLYSSADTIDITIGTAVPSTAVIRVFATLVDLS